MKKLFFTILSLGISVITAQSQNSVIINTGTPGTPAHNAGPIYRSSASSAYDACRYTYLYTQSELAAAGIFPGSTILQLGWTKNNNASTTGPGIFRIYLKTSAATDFSAATETWANLNSGATMVYENLSQEIPDSVAPSYILFPFNTSYIYTGGSLEISTEWDINGVTGNPSTGSFEWLWSTVVDRIYGTAQTSLANSGTLSSTSNSINTIDDYRPFIQITFSPPTGLDASIYPITAPLCPGSNPVQINLTSTGQDDVDSVMIAWQVNGIPQTPYKWTGSLPTGNSATVTLGNYTFSAGISYNIQAYLTDVNGLGPDSTNFNDTATVSGLQTGLSGSYTIDSAVATSGTNFQSFGDLVAALNTFGVCGPTIVNVVPGSGPYDEQITLPEISSMSDVNTVTINGHGETLQYSSTTSSNRATLLLNGADHFIIDSLHIIANGTYGFGVQLTNGADSNTISNCVVDINITSTSTNYAGIVVSSSLTSATGTGNTDCDGNTITGNVINGGYYGITLVANSSTYMIFGNRVTNNHVNDVYYYGIYLNGNNGTLVEGNNISRPSRTNPSTFYGIYLTSVSYSITVSKNLIHNSFDGNPASTSASYGIDLANCDAIAGKENLIVNNVIYNFNNAGTQNGILIGGSDYAKFYHNTISLDDQNATCTTCATRGYYLQTASVTGQEFIDNNISITRTGGGDAQGMYYAVTGSSFISDYNNIYVAGGGLVNDIGYYNGAAQTTLADWQTATGQDSNSLAVNPLFTNPTLGNFTPSNPALNDSGTYVGIADDINGTPRSLTTPDIGAYEFDINGKDAGVTVITTAACAGPDSIRVTVQNFGTDTLHTVFVYCLLNGTPTPNSGSLFTLNLASGASTVVNMGSVTYASGTSYSATAFTSTPNGLPDGNNANDTITIPVNLMLSGTYTINSAVVTGGSNYQSFTEVANDLNTFGICGPVIFNVVPGSGPYMNQQLEINDVTGTSATNTITFNGNGEWLSFASSSTSDRAGIRLNGTDYVTIDSFVIEATGTYGFGIQLVGAADNNIIRNNTVYTDTSATVSNYAGIVVSNSTSSATTSGATATNNLIENNIIRGGYYGITLVGVSSTNQTPNNKIIRNSVSMYHYYGIYSYYQDSVTIEANRVEQRDTGSSTCYGIYAYYNDYFRISKNTILTKGSTTNYGIYPYYCDASLALPNEVSNNFVSCLAGTGSAYGIYPYNNSYTNIYHNSVNMIGGGTTTGRALYLNSSSSGAYGFINVKNNIGVNTGGGYAVEISSGAVTLGYITSMDNNDWHVSGAVLARYNNSDYTDLASWKAATLLDSNSINMNPLFVSATDLHASLNFLNDRGALGTGINDDIDGDIRCPNIGCAGNTLRPDIGADEFFGTPISVDMGIQSLAAPVQTSCYSNAEPVAVSVKNYNSQSIDFSSNPITVSVSVAGPNPMTFTPVVIGNDTLGADSSLVVNISNSYDMSQPGDYVFTITVHEPTDGNPLNDSTLASIHFSVGAITNTFAQICSGSSFELKMDSITGPIQWQSYDSVNSVWVNETGVGFDSIAYSVSPTVTTIYRALVCGIFASASDTLEPVYSTPPTTTNDTICGPGMALLTATGTGTGAWYDAITGGNLVATGDTLNVSVVGDTTFYAEKGITLTGGSGLLKITEVDVDAPDGIEIQNLSSQPINTTGWVVAISNSYSDINLVNSLLWNLPSTIAPGQILFKTDASGNNYWGNNILWNPGNEGWAIILDNNGKVVDFVVWDWTQAALSGFNPTINGFSVTIGSQWTGTPLSTTGISAAQSLNRQGSSDNNVATDFSWQIENIGTQNAGLNTLFQGGSCSSSRVPAYVTVLPTPQVDLGADTTQCEGTILLDAQNPGDTYVWSTGATSQTIIADTVGTYSVTATAPNGCTDADAIHVNIVAYPTVNLGNDTTQCGGIVILSTSNASNTFHWNNGSSLPFLSVVASGTYSVTVTTPEGCERSDSVNIVINPPVTVVLRDDTTVCGGSVLLDAANAGDSYTWSTGENTQTISAAQTGTYSVIVTSSQNCTATDSVNIVINPIPMINLGNDTSLCGGPKTLDAGNPGSTYLWNTTETSQTIIADTSGTYSVRVTNSQGCESSDTVALIFHSSPSVTFNVADTICNNASPISLVGQPAGGVFSGNGVSGNNFNPSGLGAGFQNITYSFTDGNGCIANATDSIQIVICTGISETSDNLPVAIYPNPSSGKVYVDLTALSGKQVSLQVYSPDGKLIMHSYFEADNNIRSINLSNQAQGLYVIKIVSNNLVLSKRIVVQ